MITPELSVVEQEMQKAITRLVEMIEFYEKQIEETRYFRRVLQEQCEHRVKINVPSYFKFPRESCLVCGKVLHDS